MNQYELDFLLHLRNDLSKLNLKPSDNSYVNQDELNLTTLFLMNSHHCVQC